MAYTQMASIRCDSKGCGKLVISGWVTANLARKEAALSGWRVVNGKDYCPECVEKEVWNDE